MNEHGGRAHPGERILLRKREEGGYLILEETFLGELHAAIAYTERSDGGLAVYAKRRPAELVNDADKNKPVRIGIAKDEREADSMMYECALDDGQHLSRGTGKPFVDETGRTAEGSLVGRAGG